LADLFLLVNTRLFTFDISLQPAVIPCLASTVIKGSFTMSAIPATENILKKPRNMTEKTVRERKHSDILLGDGNLQPDRLWEVSVLANIPLGNVSIAIDPDAERMTRNSRKVLEKIIRDEEPVYGINTGFGYFADQRIEPDQLIELQVNIIRSHCCNVGTPLSRDIVMGMLLVTLNKLCQGHSGIRLGTIRHVIKTLEAGILAVVPSRGSVGASGDLSPSAHAARALLGEGRCTVPHNNGFIEKDAADALHDVGLSPLQPGAKEGLSLINGTALSAILAVKAWYEGKRLLRVANAAAAMAFEAMGAVHGVCHPTVLKLHRHQGTQECGREIYRYLGNGRVSDMGTQHRDNQWIQDPYSFRCAPQVHGAVWEELQHSENVLADEINAATDNPLIVADDRMHCEVFNCGHFHAIYPARVSDKIASALTTLASISERRINHAMCAKRKHLPTFLVRDGGLNSGFMMAHVTAAALVSESQSLCMPASVHSIPTNIQQEDHVSMGPIAGFKALQIVEHLRHVLAIELLCMAQGFDLQRPRQSTSPLEEIWSRIRDCVPALTKDRSLSEDIETISKAISEGRIVDFSE